MTSHATSSAPGNSSSSAMIAGRFAIIEERLRGPDFTVYRAHDTQGGSEVSVLVAPLASLGARRAACEADLAKTQRTPIPGIARTLALGLDGENIFVTTELPEGHTLRRAIDARKAQGQPVGGKVAHTLLTQLANTLAQAYQVLPHGALTPATITIGRDGHITIEAWGLARGLPSLAQTGVPEGAAADCYIAPELKAGNAPSAQSDVYALGAILYELITGLPPTMPLKPPSQCVPDLGPLVDAVIGKSRAKNPLGRQGTPQILLSELGAALRIAGTGAPLGAPLGPDTSAPGLPLVGLPAASAPLPTGGLPGGLPGGARTSGGLVVPRMTGRTFNVAEMAGLDTNSERWLVQKGKLDFGPFSLTQLKIEIERGNFTSADFVIDTESGERSRLDKHPQLADFTRAAEQRLEATRRAHAELKLEKSERKKGRVSRLVIAGAFLAVLLGGGLYFYSLQSATDEGFAARVGEADIDAFLRGVKLEFNQPRKTAPSKPRTVGGKGGDEFDNSVTLGDLSKGGGDAVLSEEVIQDVMMKNYRGLIPCIMHARAKDPSLSNIDLDFVVLGAGRVSAVKVNGQQGTPLSACVLDRMKAIKFPSFDGTKTIASWSMSIR